MHEPGPLVASGRDADIFEYGPGLVLRRARDGRPIGSEAQVMDHLHAQGYPVPRIEEVSDDGTAIVMERIDGADMVASVSRRPWAVARYGRLLGELHLRLHQLQAPPWLRRSPVGPSGDRIVHLDLHPLNVLITSRGPVVIDWANAGAGAPGIDVALAWILLATGRPPAGPLLRKVITAFRRHMLDAFLATTGRDEARTALRAGVEYKVQDPHMAADEVADMWRLLECEAL